MHRLINKLNERFPELRFTAGSQFCWSPESGEIFYNQQAGGQAAVWSLLHETGHALLGHSAYRADFQLLKMEMAAWDEARRLAADLNLQIDEEHIQDCLDTYRDWLFKRSVCPTCTAKSLQQGDYLHYRCFNCHTVWRVSSSRFCRVYRATKNVSQDD